MKVLTSSGGREVMISHLIVTIFGCFYAIPKHTRQQKHQRKHTLQHTLQHKRKRNHKHKQRLQKALSFISIFIEAFYKKKLTRSIAYDSCFGISFKLGG